MKSALLVVSHGSREAAANREFILLVGKYRKRHPGWKIRHAFLELASPSIPQALESMASSAEILVLPLFLFSAKHVKKHIPEILKTFRERHSKVRLKLAKPLGSDLKLLDILDQRVRKALD